MLCKKRSSSAPGQMKRLVTSPRYQTPHLSDIDSRMSAGIGTFGAYTIAIHSPLGCRGFTGPVPPPLWIRAPQGLFDLARFYHGAPALSSLRAVWVWKNMPDGGHTANQSHMRPYTLCQSETFSYNRSCNRLQ